MDSIMLYGSTEFANIPALCNLGHHALCTLVKIDWVNGEKVLTRFEGSKITSAGDVKFVKLYYPWEDAAAPHQPDPSPSPGMPPPGPVP